MSDSEFISREARNILGKGRFEGPVDGCTHGLIEVTAVGREALDRATKLLAGISGGVDKAVRSAMSRTVPHLRKSTVKAIPERYAISATNIRANENVTVSYTYRDGVQAFVSFGGYKIPLYRFNGASPKQPSQDTSQWIQTMINERWKTVHPSLAAYGHVLKSTSPTRFQNAFVARMGSTGHVGIFERTGGKTSKRHTDEIEEFFGPSIPQMLGSKEVEEKISAEAMKKFDERLDHEILRILNGWGG